MRVCFWEDVAGRAREQDREGAFVVYIYSYDGVFFLLQLCLKPAIIVAHFSPDVPSPCRVK